MFTMGLNEIVGRIAGAIYSDVTARFPVPPLLLVPAITFKVRQIMEHINLGQLTDEQKEELAHDIQIAIVPVLFSYDIKEPVIREIAPTIESAALKALAFL